ncbi:heme utilization protein [Pseudomonas gingeri]|uniref:Heme utilization protein n=1 Tax=Pseudomonas gingeri TaxID=117681 RepID=A0A7Y7YCI2_9PSED|nr:heme utilization protein [Pseudomonas gingeri]NWA01789.1 heme utilization protein [Pseudomonas gingeri]NWA12888.1 heme utilization protein [Pseudomonas gingeri]NWA57630.1 heme utilization protein [Pseudomonas gingeri]NWA93259.1 heme utilization protein [Pseudomonas gingeri]NWB03381.1 heme utilization protein [Pseudomonas gingeri]
MKPTMALKPLVFALAAVMAMAAQAGGNDNHGNGHGNGHGNNHDPKGPDLSTLLQITAGAGAAVIDTQYSHNNAVVNQGTKNNASANDSLNHSSGNMGANVAAGDGNQQDNAAALATADESFIFGTAVAASSATQTNTSNIVLNQSTKNNASMNDSGNNGSGNMGVNITAGNFNQQKNNLAIAVSGGRVATAAAAANQTESGLLVTNAGVQDYKKTTLTGTFYAHGSYKGTGYGKIEGDDDHHGGGNGHGNKGGHDNDDQKFTFKEQGDISLAGYWTQQVLTPDGWKNVVTNNASMNNSANFMSGNAGINVSAGVGNQQSNSLSIAAGCKACM